MQPSQGGLFLFLSPSSCDRFCFVALLFAAHETPNFLCRLGEHYPTRTHTRDGAMEAFVNNDPDVNTLCGALVSGPYDTSQATDAFPDNRKVFEAAEAALDFSGSAICAFGAYAAMPAGAFDKCSGVQSPLTGRLNGGSS